MARYLRDEAITDLTITEESLRRLTAVFEQRGLVMPEYHPVAEGEDPAVFLFYTIRFDQKGYRVYSTEELVRYFNEAGEVERIIFELDSAAALRSNRAVGSYANLRLDTSETVTCFLTVDSDNEEWVNTSFTAIKEVLSRFRNRNSLLRNPWVELSIQVVGIVIGFVFSLWAATKIAPSLAIENAFLVSFLLVLVVFSNLWGPINQRLKRQLFLAFPVIRFYRPTTDRLHWLYQALVGGVAVAVTLYFLGMAFTYAGKVLGTLIGGGT